MKQFARSIGRLLRRIYTYIRKIRIPRKAVALLVILAVGIGVGFWLGRTTAPATLQTSKASSVQNSPEAHKLESAYSDSKDRIAADQKSKRVTSEQAKAIRAKLDELYNFRKDMLGKATSESVSDRSQMRQEIRDWAKDNDVPTRYFIRLY